MTEPPFDWSRSHPAGDETDDGTNVIRACLTDQNTGKPLLITAKATPLGAVRIDVETDLPVVVTGTFVGPEMPS